MADSTISEEIAEAVDELLDEGGEVITIAGTNFLAFVEPLEIDEVIIAGGEGDKGGFRVWVRIADLPALPPTLSVVVANGSSKRFLSAEKLSAHWVLICGEPMGEQQ